MDYATRLPLILFSRAALTESDKKEERSEKVKGEGRKKKRSADSRGVISWEGLLDTERVGEDVGHL